VHQQNIGCWRLSRGHAAKDLPDVYLTEILRKISSTCQALPRTLVRRCYVPSDLIALFRSKHQSINAVVLTNH
jgi:hypothetical protein